MTNTLAPDEYDISTEPLGESYNPKTDGPLDDDQYDALFALLKSNYASSNNRNFGIYELKQIESNRYIVSFHVLNWSASMAHKTNIAIVNWAPEQSEWTIKTDKRVSTVFRR